MDLVSADWSVKAERNLVSKPPSKEEVDRFLNEIGVGINGPGRYGLDSFRFADLRRNGQLSLLLSSGRFGNFTSVIDKTVSGFEWRELPSGFGGADAEDVGSGRMAIVIPAQLTNYEGAMHCVATWPVIYAWTGTVYADASRNFSLYYRRKLQSVKMQIAGNPPNEQGKADCLKAEAAKIERFLGNKTAGLDDALRWSRSRQGFRHGLYQRAFAVGILDDIGTPEAMKCLKELAAERDPEVAIPAENDIVSKLGYLHTPPAKKALEGIASHRGEYGGGGLAKSFLLTWNQGTPTPDGTPETTLIPFSALNRPSAKPTQAK
ncbi:MAG: hypothetical protein ACREQI_07905 [Candidatus Binataceae bacterium]